MNLIKKLKCGIKEVVEDIKFERSSVKIHFDYHLSENNLDKNLMITQAVKNAKDSTEAKYDEVKVYYHSPTGLIHAEHHFAIYAPDAHTAMNAFDDFIRTAGTSPDFIANENLDLVNRVLRNHNQRLEKRWVGRAVGRYVVDM